MFSRRSGNHGRGGSALQLQSRTCCGAVSRSRGRDGRRPTVMVCRRCLTITAGRLAGAGLPPSSGCGHACRDNGRPIVRHLARRSPVLCGAGRLGRCISRVVRMDVGGGSLICHEVCFTASLWSCGVGSTAGRAARLTSGRGGGRSRVAGVPFTS